MSNIDKSLKRYKILDTCLGDQSRSWTLEDLVAQCSAVDPQKKVGLRTIQMDIQYLRTTYQAPIEVYGGKFYRYAGQFSIFKQVPAGHELQKILNALEVINSAANYSIFTNLSYDILKLEESFQQLLHGGQEKILDSPDTRSPSLVEIMQCISQKKSILLSRTKNGQQLQTNLCPYLIKEYEDHLYVCGWNIDRSKINVIALNDIQECAPSEAAFYKDPDFDQSYFQHLIGVHRKMNDHPIILHLMIHPEYASEITQYPLHHSQQTISVLPTGTKIALKVIWNDALEARILSYGPKLQVTAPKELRKRILASIKKTKKEYEKD
jgi:predicted DNA-binding transcriptional regulator YafY